MDMKWINWLPLLMYIIMCMDYHYIGSNGDKLVVTQPDLITTTPFINMNDDHWNTEMSSQHLLSQIIDDNDVKTSPIVATIMNKQVDVCNIEEITYTSRWSVRFGVNSNDGNSSSSSTIQLNNGDSILLDISDLTLLGGIMINTGAKLIVEDSRDYHVQTPFIILNGGEFHIGSQECPFRHHFTLTLTDRNTAASSSTSSSSSSSIGHFGEKVLAVAANGVLELHGAHGLQQSSWTKLSETIHTGDHTLKVVDTNVDWRVGDVLVVASTDFNMNQAEQVRITHVIAAGHFRIEPSFQYMHFGAITFGVDERGEVGLISRNIVIQGQPKGSFGGHVMFTKGFKAVHIEGVELNNMGQANTVGRYPIHFHMCNRVPEGTYVRYSSVHHSHFRCMTIHGSHGVRLERNVAYDAKGHCFFFEDGSEQDNVLDGNLALVTRRKEVNGPSSNEAGLRSDWEAPSTYWITHPNNIIINNVAGGSDHTGMWYLFRETPSGLSLLSGLYNNATPPVNVPLGLHRGNVIHSCGTAGLFLEPTNHNFALDNDGIDVQHKSPFGAYHPKVDGMNAQSIFEDDVIYKTRIKGAWFRGLSVWFKNCRFADNQAGLTIATAGSHPDGDGGGLTTGAIFVGFSDNKGQDVAGQPPMNLDKGATTPQGPGVPLRGYQFYDGPQTVKDSVFLRYVSDSYAHHSAVGLFYQNTWQMASTNGVENIRFDETSTRYWIQVSTAPDYILRLDGDTNAIVYDHDGSLSGYRSATIINNYPYFTTDKCMVRSNWNAAICPHRYVNVWIENLATEECHSPELRQLFVPGLNIYRDQHRTPANEMKQEVLGIPQMDRNGNKYRYQVIATPEASYILNFPHVTPSFIRLQMNNGDVSDALRYGICYPAGSRIVRVIRGLFKNNHEPGSVNDGITLFQANSMEDHIFKSGDGYYWDAARNMLFITLTQRYERLHHDAYCPSQGCEQVWIHAQVPTGASPVSCSNIAYPHYQVTEGAFFDRTLNPVATAAISGEEATSDHNHTMNTPTRRLSGSALRLQKWLRRTA